MQMNSVVVGWKKISVQVGSNLTEGDIVEDRQKERRRFNRRED